MVTILEIGCSFDSSLKGVELFMAIFLNLSKHEIPRSLKKEGSHSQGDSVGTT